MTAQAPLAGGRSQRRERDMQRWLRRSAMIAFFRRALPAAIAGIVLLFVAWLVFGGLIQRLNEPRAAGPGTIHMTNARFLGRDEGGRAYVLTADEAARDNADFQRVTLNQPMLLLDADSPNPTRLSADQGVYREDNRILLLDGHVQIRDGQGDVFNTAQAIVDTVQGAVAGKSHVDGQGPTGTFRADSYAVYDRGQRLVFQGHVHSHINPH